MADANILIVDDSQVNVELLKVFLQHSSWFLDVAANGEQAVQKCKENDYQVILMDMHMPIMNGYDATKAIRALENHKTNAIIAVTADVTPENKQRSLEAGCNIYLEKPVMRDTIRDLVFRYI